MTVLRFARFTLEPTKVEQMFTRRATLVAAIKERFSGLIGAELARLDDRTWIDIWRWDSMSSAQAATAAAPSMPEVAAAVAVAGNFTMEHAELVDER